MFSNRLVLVEDLVLMFAGTMNNCCGFLEFQDGTMDQPSGKSFMQVLCEKYSPENFPYRRGPGMGVHVPATPQGSPMKGNILTES